LIALTKTLGRELAPENITINAIAPGVIDRPQLRVDADNAGVSPSEMPDEYHRSIPLGRIGGPDEIVAAVALLVRRELGRLSARLSRSTEGQHDAEYEQNWQRHRNFTGRAGRRSGGAALRRPVDIRAAAAP
jgi:NAD(P)-dependent dehydrogenase (short-subunit alcohol dehydrogenase family)